MKKSSVKMWGLLFIAFTCYQRIEAACERSPRILAAEDVCWTAKIKIADRIQYTTKSVLNFAKEKLGLDTEEPYHPQKCDYYQCIFGELKMLNSDGYPNYEKIVEWIDNNIIYNHAKTQYDRLKECNTALTASIASNTYFSGDLAPNMRDLPQLQDKCVVLEEFMKCIALNGTEIRKDVMDNNGEDEVGNGKNDGEAFHDAEDGNCLNGNSERNIGRGDEGDALGRPGGRPGEVYARMPVHKYATHYKMDHKKRGIAIIFNHETFECGGLKSRSGTNEDCKNLKDCLTSLGFNVLVFKDLNYKDLEQQVRLVSEMDHTHHDCILLAVLSHGEMGIIYAKDTPYKPDNLWSLFTADRCPSLAGKPKLFFLQACQGDKLDGGVSLTTSRTETDGEIHNTYKIPVQADFLIVYSTVKGYYSWRNTTKGSWFIQALCEELQRRVHEQDLMTILTFVSQRVALDFESNVPDSLTMHRQKQIPCVMSMLTRLIKFTVPGTNLGDNNSVEKEPEKARHVFSSIFGSKTKA